MRNKFTLILISYFILGISICFGQTKQKFNAAGVDYVRETFTSTVSNWPVPPGVSSVTYLVVAGGGGGGGAYDSSGAGGGGGGQVLTGTFTFSGETTLNVVVGSGGTAGTASRPVENDGGDGSNSSFGTVIAIGGTGGLRSRGGGTSAGGALNTGGNGGGGGFAGGGGGGNSNAGGNGERANPGLSNDGGSGGAGTTSSLSGSSVVYSIGGLGGASVGGIGLAGNNGSTPTANRGHGGPGAGCSGQSDMNGRAGSAGIVIITYIDNTVLPVSFKLFNATASANAVNLHWQTTSESNNSHFIIKRSTDGINFESFASVPSNGNTNEANYYNLADKKPNIGINYYQLAQVDNNGDTKILSTQSALFEVGKPATSRVYPNPFTSSVKTSFEQGTFKNAVLSDVSGKVLTSVSIAKDQTECTFKTDTFPSGIYFIKLSGKQAVTYKVVKP